ncbi:transporter [Alcanivorax sp. S6407]|uniref:transporter n=1 Tax=Alcanivorax sp. S6407 TaxID=2926424 RepID=UPI001FF114FE|nr:transporter [Alcanivorax sp. S6407]MCK0154770.1 transporter [Alcanivorax sp. S6407]
MRWLFSLFCLPGMVLAAPPFERPGLGLNPDTLQQHRVVLEQGLPDATLDQRYSPEISTLNFNTLLRMQVVSRMEIQLGINTYRYQKFDSEKDNGDLDGLGDSSLGAKFAIYRGEIFRAALLGGMLMDTSSDGFSDDEDGSFAALSGGWWLDDRHQLQLSVRFEDDGTESSTTVVPSWHARLSDEWAVFLDAGFTRNQDNGDDNNRAGGGITWMATPNIQLDVYGRGALDTGSVDNEAGLGVGIAF